MIKKRLFSVKVLLLLFVFTITIVNVASAWQDCEGGDPSWRCQTAMLAWCISPACLNHGGCNIALYHYNYCDFYLCYELWSFHCNDGYSEYQHCANRFLSPCEI